MAPPRIGRDKKWWDVQGRVCVKRNDFYALRGYDERVMEYGYEDQDFKSRLQSMGRKKIVIKDKAFLHAITHEDSLRIAESFSTKKAKDLFISIAEDSATQIIYLQEDYVFERFYSTSDNATIIDLKNMYKGSYDIEDSNLRLYKENGKEFFCLTYKTNDHLVTDDGRNFYRVTSSLLRENFLLKRAIYLGKKIFSHNRINGNMVNCDGFGKGTVYRNFSDKGIHLDVDKGPFL
jgi:inhibitor of KinA sporulation pathway (predicted exonuclease)